MLTIDQAINDSISAHNQQQRDAENTGNKGKKRKREPHQEYVFEPIVRNEKKGGIDSVRYRDKILLDLLYPFYEKVRDKHPDREVWLIEDNASSHTKAAKMCADIIKEKRIKKVEWPANSPDLHPIENVWDCEKDLLAPKWRELRGSGKNVQEKARRETAKVWQSDKVLAKAREICGGLQAKLELCKAPKGKNNFRGL